MINFQKGGNWQDWGGHSGGNNLEWHNRPEELIEWQKQDREGLPDRWVQIVEGRVGWCWLRSRRFLLNEPKAHCVKEGLWKW